MRAAQYKKYGDPEVLHESTADTPRIKRGRVLVKVHGSSVNQIEVLVRKGALRVVTGPFFPKGVGMDFAGEVAEVGLGVVGLKPGDRVWGFTGGLPLGRTIAAAEYLLAKPKWLSVAPANLDLVSAGSLPMVGATSIVSLRDHLKLEAGDSLLIRGASGGVGSIAVQLGKAMGARVTALTNAANLEFVRGLGADEALDYRTTSPKDLDRFDAILDTSGVDMAAYRALLRTDGRMVTTALDKLVQIARSVVHGSRRVRFFSVPPRTKTFAFLTELVSTGKIVPVIDSVYPLADAAGAHRSLESGGGHGKRVISVIADK
jgi:NADPH:quinone reductase-like Zn-dependent oxidoreductase